MGRKYNPSNPCPPDMAVIHQLGFWYDGQTLRIAILCGQKNGETGYEPLAPGKKHSTGDLRMGIGRGANVKKQANAHTKKHPIPYTKPKLDKNGMYSVFGGKKKRKWVPPTLKVAEDGRVEGAT